MASDNYILPKYLSDGFNCPHCHIYAHQQWRTKIVASRNESGGISNKLPELSSSICDRCKKFALWYEEQLVYPLRYVSPPASDNMPEIVKGVYEEACSVFTQSPRGAAALLRLAIQRLVIELGESDKNLNEAIGNLVKKGLPERIQKALDIVRVIGNNAVHPGQITIEDNPDIALSLFTLVNLIVDAIITKTKEIDKLYDMLPQSAKAGIVDRDGAVSA